MSEINIQDNDIRQKLNQLEAALEDMSPLYLSVSEMLYAETMENFAQEGRPSWQKLSPVTIAIRTKLGTWPGKILNVSAGGLASSIHPSSGKDFAAISTNKPYGRIQHLGGFAGRNNKVHIPARRYFPITEALDLQPQAKTKLIDLLNEYLQHSLS